MFFRLKETRSGQVLKLIESYRDDTGKPRHRTVASLGNAPLKRKDWKEVARILEARLYARDELFPRDIDPSIGEWVDRIARQVSSEGRWKAFDKESRKGCALDGVLLEEVTHTETTELGSSLVGWEVWKRLGMPELLRVLGFSRSQSEAAALSVINRLVEPVSEHSLLDWYRRTGLPELMGNQLRGAGDDRFYRVSDLLLSRQGEIEHHLRERQQSLFNLDRTVLLYDLTNSHFEGACRKNPKARRGVNKQKRNDCPQIVVGMVFDQFGFEMAHKVFEGTQNDGKSLLLMIEELNRSAGNSGSKPLIIIDGGVATRSNLILLRENGFSYLVNDSRRKRSVYKDWFSRRDSFRVVQGRGKKAEVLVQVLDDPEPSDEIDWKERVVLCRSSQRMKKEEAIHSRAEERFIEALQKLAERIEKGHLKDPKKIQRAIGRIQAKHTRVQRYYQVDVQQESEDATLLWSRDEVQLETVGDLWGCYVLRTDEATLNEHDLWKLYICLTHAEDGFKALKTNVGLRPNRHHKEKRVDGHVFICVLAYHLLRHILWILEEKGDHRNWETLKRVLQTHCYTTILLPTEKGQTHRIRKAGQPEECQKEIYRNLGIDWRGLPHTRSVIGGALIDAKRDISAPTL